MESRTSAEAQRQRQVALRRLERDRRGHHPGDAVDVAADDHHRAHFGYRAAEPRQHDRHQRKAQVPQQRQRGRHGARAQRLQLFARLLPRIADHLPRKGGEERRHQDRLRDDHRRRREQDAEGAQRARARQQQVDEEADDHRGQAHQRIERHDGRTSSAKLRHRDQRAERHGEERRDEDRPCTDAQRQEDDLDQLGIAQCDEAPGFGECQQGRAHA